MESEGQLRPLLKRRRENDERWIVQTKIRPYDVQEDTSVTDGGLYGTAANKGGSLETLGYEHIDMITIHGVNSPHQCGDDNEAHPGLSFFFLLPIEVSTKFFSPLVVVVLCCFCCTA